MKKGLLTLLLAVTASLAGVEWHSPFYVSGGTPHTRRIQITVKNSGETVSGVPLELSAAQLGLVGTPSKEIRVVDQDGKELLYRLVPEENTIPGQGKLFVPVSAGENKTTVLWIYSGNRNAWALPDRWYFRADAARLAKQFTVSIGKTETLTLETEEHSNRWSLPVAEWPDRLIVSIYNISSQKIGKRLCSIPVNRLLHANYPASAFCLQISGKETPFVLVAGSLIFELEEMAPRTERLVVLYLAAGRKNQTADVSIRRASWILSDMEAAGPGAIDKKGYERLLNSPANLFKDPSFEEGSGWIVSGERNGKKFHVSRIEPGGIFGSKMATLDIPQKAPADWYGFRQSIHARDGAKYLFAGWVNSPSGLGTIWAHELSGNPGVKGFDNYNVQISGKGWQPFTMEISARSKNSVIDAHLTAMHGVYHYDGMLLAEVADIGEVRFENYAEQHSKETLAVSQVHPIIKIFPDTIPGKMERGCAQIAMARNEKEGLQLAVRSLQDHPEITISASVPRNENDLQLPAPEIGVIQYVKVDAPSRYFGFPGTKSYQLCAPAGTRNELWPDPVLPRSNFSLVAGRTQGIYLRFYAPPEAEPGLYRGCVTLKSRGKTVKELPYQIRVWNFVLPQKPETTAIFDNRFPIGREHKKYTEMEAADFLRKSRLSYDEIPVKPKFKRNADGSITADFTEFDKAAEIWFHEWNIPFAYLPLFREVFGWSRPPRSILGVAPYPGKSPYAGVDRGRFTPEYKKICQTILKLMKEHLTEKGWADRFILYVADEPMAERDGIIEQLSALCDMFHEVWPEIRIYASTWMYVPQWVGKIDVWGIGVQGQISEENMEKLRKSGAELLITTDGQMCIDTPYNSIERLLPVYAWKYKTLGYEFWGADHYSYNPYLWGIHRPWRNSRYPNGDGYIFYPGNLIGQKEFVPTIRMESLRDGVEDYSYCTLLEKLVRKTGDPEGKKLLEEIKTFTRVPSVGGRKSELLLPDPESYGRVRDKIGEAIDRLNR